MYGVLNIIALILGFILGLMQGIVLMISSIIIGIFMFIASMLLGEKIPKKTIIVSDDGIPMTEDEIRDELLKEIFKRLEEEGIK